MNDLLALRSIGGKLFIALNVNLENLDGLSGLTSVKNFVAIQQNRRLCYILNTTDLYDHFMV